MFTYLRTLFLFCSRPKDSWPFSFVAKQLNGPSAIHPVPRRVFGEVAYLILWPRSIYCRWTFFSDQSPLFGDRVLLRPKDRAEPGFRDLTVLGQPRLSFGHLSN